MLQANVELAEYKRQLDTHRKTLESRAVWRRPPLTMNF